MIRGDDIVGVKAIKYKTKRKGISFDENWPFYNAWGMGQSKIMECISCLNAIPIRDGTLKFKCKITNNKIPGAGLKINEDCPLLSKGE